MAPLFAVFPGSPAPLRPGTPLASVIRLAHPGVPVGAWVRGCQRLFVIRAPGRKIVLAGVDLSALLRRCDRVVIRDGDAAVAVAASVLVGWRVLEVVLGTPFLPPPAQLRALFPRLRATPGTLAIPIGLGSAEEALAICAGERVPVVGTRIAYESASG